MGNIEVFALGFVLGGIFLLMFFVVSGKFTRGPISGPTPVEGVHPWVCIGENQMAILDALKNLAGVERVSSGALGEIKDWLYADKVDHERMEKLLEPIQSALFRIAADTELSKAKFDVLGKLLGLDDKGVRAGYIDRAQEDEDAAPVLSDMVVQEMKTYGLNWKQASDKVKSDMAHRSRVRA